MAKVLHKVTYTVEVTYSGGVQDQVKIRDVNYSTCESASPDLKGHGGLHQAENVPRTLDTTSGLEDTVQQLTDDLETEIKTKEGI